MTSVVACQIVVDVSGLARRYQNAELLSAFDSLGVGESLFLVGSQGLQACLRELRSRRRGLFEWCPLGPEGSAGRVEITRRSAIAGDFRRLGEALAWDHARLQGLAAQVVEALKARRVDAVRCLYHGFAYSLKRHILVEEELLFPLFEAKTGLPQARATASFEAEHAEITRLLEGLGQDLDRVGPEAATVGKSLLRMLDDHSAKEESTVYQALDRVLSEAEGDDFVAAVQNFPS
jgi:hemerythrin-like domain-containing protein